jgi:GNAT superfamily N-acetyltransferase
MANLQMTQDLDLSTDWVTEPPIRKLEPAEVKLHGEWLQAAILGWQDTAPGGGPEQTRWNKRIAGGEERAYIISVCDASYEVYAYFYSGKPVGLMSLNPAEYAKKGGVYIEDLVAHPGARNAGDLLVEKAVNLSRAGGYGGKLVLAALPGSHGFYKSVGFVPVHGGVWPAQETLLTCELMPKPPLWAQLNNRWKLTSMWQARNGGPVLEPVPGGAFRN